MLVKEDAGDQFIWLFYYHWLLALLLFSLLSAHDDVIKWKHFPRYWPFVWGIHRSPVNSPHKGQWRGVLIFSLICVWINGWVNNRQAGDLRRHRGHYDVNVMKGQTFSCFHCCQLDQAVDQTVKLPVICYVTTAMSNWRGGNVIECGSKMSWALKCNVWLVVKCLFV